MPRGNGKANLVILKYITIMIKCIMICLENIACPEIENLSRKTVSLRYGYHHPSQFLVHNELVSGPRQ